MSIKTYLYLILSGLLILGLGLGYKLYLENQALKIKNQIEVQNRAALEDSLKIQAGKMTEITSFVKNLQTDLSKAKKQNIALQINNQMLIDSIQILKRNAHTESTDSTITVSFDGTEKIVKFDGWTMTNLKSMTSEWGLNMNFLPIDTRSELFQENEIWKIRTISLTDGVMVKGISTIDEKTFMALQKYAPPISPKNIGVTVHLQGFKEIYLGLTTRINREWLVDIGYRMSNKSSIWNENILIGGHYFIF